MKIIITGPGGSGKDYLIKKFKEKKFSIAATLTTRKKRSSDENCFFITKKMFTKLINEKFFWVWKEYNDNYYGFLKSQEESSDVFIMPPDMLKDISRENIFVIYLDIDEKVRLERLKERKNYDDNPESRIERDKKQFENFKNYDLRIKNHDF